MLVQRKIAQAIGVVGKKCLLVLKQMSHAHQPLPQIRVHSSIDKRDSPVVDTFFEKFDATSALRKHEIRRHCRTIFQEKLTNQVTSVAKTQNEIFVPEVRVVTHQVPKNRAITDIHERLRNGFGMLAQARAETPAKQDYLHRASS